MQLCPSWEWLPALWWAVEHFGIPASISLPHPGGMKGPARELPLHSVISEQLLVKCPSEGFAHHGSPRTEQLSSKTSHSLASKLFNRFYLQYLSTSVAQLVRFCIQTPPLIHLQMLPHEYAQNLSLSTILEHFSTWYSFCTSWYFQLKVSLVPRDA